ncbi:MAG TPA: methyltransferase domain-containing protein [Fimbriiglobus sp.]|jgi:2-polyprenyl-3-methyl-5-hydroxy-6-metoxy-1,4-benzoquinol methylase
MPVEFDTRHLTAELMDNLGIAPAVLDSALVGLAHINAWTRSTACLAGPVLNQVRKTPGRTFRILDVASGAGDVPIRLYRAATAAGLSLEIDGCDVQPHAVSHANRMAKRCGSRVRFFRHDVLREPLPAGYDAVTCSLFLHHLTDGEAVTLLRRMADAGRVVYVCDLVRSRTTFLLVWIACHTLTRSRVNWSDGPASARAAFKPLEAAALAERAGMTDVVVARRRPCRFLLTGRKGSSA